MDSNQVSFVLNIPDKNGNQIFIQLYAAQSPLPLTLLACPKVAGKPIQATPGPEIANGPPACGAAGRRSDLFPQLLAASLDMPNLPVSLSFKSQRGDAGVACKLKVVMDGTLYPLAQGLLFGATPILFLPLAQITSAKIVRSPSRTCVFHVTALGIRHEFSMIDEGEMGSLSAYVAATMLERQAKLASSQPATQSTSQNIDENDQDDSNDTDDSDYRSSESSSSVVSDSEEGEQDDDREHHSGDVETGGVPIESNESNEDSNAESSDDEQDEDSYDGSIAELVDEEPFKADSDVEILEGSKRARRGSKPI